MTLLLDTHAFLWFAAGDARLSRKARVMMTQPDVELLISAATVWELAIKSSLERLRLPTPLDVYIAGKIEEGYRLLDIQWTHSARVEQLSFHHCDPFDRLLAAQALVERLPLVTRDRVFRKYGVTTVW